MNLRIFFFLFALFIVVPLCAQETSPVSTERPDDALAWLIQTRDAWPKEVVLQTPMKLNWATSGAQASVDAKVGTKLTLTNIEGDTLDVLFGKAANRVPMSATDFAARAPALKQAYLTRPQETAPAATPVPTPESQEKAPVVATSPTTKTVTTVPRKKGNVTYTLLTSKNPSEDELDAYKRISIVMNAACQIYNEETNLSRHLIVSYVPGVPTAQANMNGTIQFGKNRTYMSQCAAMHEMGHTFGVGQSGRWHALIVKGVYQGANANAVYRSFPGVKATDSIKGDKMHFWPYGLNFPNEWKSAEDGRRHARIVEAMKKDGVYSVYQK